MYKFKSRCGLFWSLPHSSEATRGPAFGFRASVTVDVGGLETPQGMHLFHNNKVGRIHEGSMAQESLSTFSSLCFQGSKNEVSPAGFLSTADGGCTGTSWLQRGHSAWARGSERRAFERARVLGMGDGSDSSWLPTSNNAAPAEKNSALFFFSTTKQRGNLRQLDNPNQGSSARIFTSESHREPLRTFLL